MMIAQGISQSPFYTTTETQSMTMSGFNTPCCCPSVALALSPGEHVHQSPCKRRRCRKVEFGPDVTLAYIESSSEFTQVEKDDRWYRSSQVESFKKGARNLCRTQLDANNASIPRHSPTQTLRKGHNNAANDTLQDSCRGLDVYYPARQRFGKKYIEHVLEAYHVRCVGNDVHVALLAEKWSKKSLNRAQIMAKKDFICAHYFQSSKEAVEYECPLPMEVPMEETQKQTSLLPVAAASTLMHDLQQQQILATLA